MRWRRLSRYAIAVDGSGNIVLGGSFLYNLNFGNGLVPSIGSSEDAFIAKVKPDGSYIWFKPLATASTMPCPASRSTERETLLTRASFTDR